MVKPTWLSVAFCLFCPITSLNADNFGSLTQYESNYQNLLQDKTWTGETLALRWANDNDQRDISADTSPAQIYTMATAESSRYLPQTQYVRVHRMRAEFEHQSALLVSGGSLAMSAPDVLVELAQSVAGHVPLVMLVNDEQEQEAAIRLLAMHGVPTSGTFLNVPHNTIWVRDYGPTVLASQLRTIVVDSAYSEIDRGCDDAVPSVLARLSKTETRHTSLHIPGGNLLSNGRGLCVTTTRLQEENTDRTQQEIANAIADAFGATTVAILEPLQGESTGHVDMFATFTDPHTVVVGKYDQFSDPANAAILDRNAELLASHQTGSRGLRVVRIPMPPRSEECWPTFTNVVYANGRLLVPSYGSTTESEKEEIRRIYSKLLPTWHVHFIRADDLIRSGGALHCVVSNLGSLFTPIIQLVGPPKPLHQPRFRVRLGSPSF